MLKRIRKIKQISQKEIVKALKISKSKIYRFEKGGSISTDEYLEYCKYLGVDAGIPYLISEDDDFYCLFEQIVRSSYDYEMFELNFYTALLKAVKQVFNSYR